MALSGPRITREAKPPLPDGRFPTADGRAVFLPREHKDPARFRITSSLGKDDGPTLRPLAIRCRGPGRSTS